VKFVTPAETMRLLWARRGGLHKRKLYSNARIEDDNRRNSLLYVRAEQLSNCRERTARRRLHLYGASGREYGKLELSFPGLL